MKNRVLGIITIALLLLVSAGCSQTSGDVGDSSSVAAVNQDNSNSIKGARDNTIRVLTPQSSGTDVKGNEYVSVDISNSNEGYIIVQYLGSSTKIKFQVTGEDQVTYTYNLTGDAAVIPLSSGSGAYTIGCYEHIEGTSYAQVYVESIDVEIANEFGPFLYPNQYVNFTESSKTVAKAAEVVASANDDLEAVSCIYTYVTENVEYDYDKASSVGADYLPVVDETLDSNKGICFDYAALMSAMLRSQGIPTKLVIGYAGSTYHAWISVYITDVGWVNNVIYFDGVSWTLMDPTYAASTDNNAKIKEYVGDGSRYNALYVY